MKLSIVATSLALLASPSFATGHDANPAPVSNTKAAAVAVSGVAFGSSISVKPEVNTTIKPTTTSAVTGSGNSRISKSGNSSIRTSGNVAGQAIVSVSNNDETKPAPYAPSIALTASGISCNGSASGSFGNGIFSAGIGATIESEPCNAREDAKVLHALGLHSAAVARLCMDSKKREAIEASGGTCPPREAKTTAIDESSGPKPLY
ncbi:MAG: hypothetical protein IPM06_17915 [Rhizobiales bacterium]|nr:hypothetical protein [Hyphomicrobiales bacterium]